MPAAEREDDALIGMMLSAFKWDYAKAAEMYQLSVRKREELGMSKIKDEIVSQQLQLEDLPHHRAVMCGQLNERTHTMVKERSAALPARLSAHPAWAQAGDSDLCVHLAQAAHHYQRIGCATCHRLL